MNNFEKIKIFEQIKQKAAIFTSEFELACGAIQALEWVLQEDNQ